MKSQSLFLRVPVVIFAVLVGGIYVYARSGGRFWSTPARVTPAAANDPHEAGASLMMGSKSAPAFLPEEAASAQSVQTAGEPANQAILLPGSKSAAIVVGEETLPPAADPAPRLLPGSKSVILADPPRLLPGSKSDVLISPPVLAPQPVQQQSGKPTANQGR